MSLWLMMMLEARCTKTITVSVQCILTVWVLLPSGAQLEVRSAPATLVSGPSCQVRWPS